MGLDDSIKVPPIQHSGKSIPASHHVYSDGSNIQAVPQPNPSGPAFDEIEGADIGPVLQEVIVDQLPPQGSKKEGAGKIVLKRSDYPGDLSNGDSVLNGTILPSQTVIEGELASHDEPNATDPTIPTTESPVRLNFSTNGFVCPDVDNDMLIWPVLKNLELWGPGTASGTGLDTTTGTNVWDWFYFENVHVRNCLDPVTVVGDARGDMVRCGFTSFEGTCTIKNRKYLTNCSFETGKVGAYVDLAEMRAANCSFHGTGETNPYVQALDSMLTNIRGEKVGGTSGSGTWLKLNRSGVCLARIQAGDFNRGVRLAFNEPAAAFVFDQTTGTYTFSSGGANGTIWGPEGNGIENPTGARWINGSPMPEDLTARSGSHAFEVAAHDGTDGTNVNDREPAYWENVAAEWRGVYSGTVIA